MRSERTRTRRRLRLRGGALVAVLVVAGAAGAGCGVGTTGPVAFPVATLSSPVAGPTVAARGTPEVFLVAGEQLVPEPRATPPGRSVDAVLRRLAAPLSRAETREGLRSIVAIADPSDPFFAPAPVPEGTASPRGVAMAHVIVNEQFRTLPPDQQLLAIGQVTLSLDAAGFDSVAFVDGQGTSLRVPGPGGRVLNRPVTARDYARLVSQSERNQSEPVQSEPIQSE